MFDAVDVDKDGMLRAEELRRCIHNLGIVPVDTAYRQVRPLPPQEA